MQLTNHNTENTKPHEMTHRGRKKWQQSRKYRVRQKSLPEPHATVDGGRVEGVGEGGRTRTRNAEIDEPAEARHATSQPRHTPYTHTYTHTRTHPPYRRSSMYIHRCCHTLHTYTPSQTRSRTHIHYLSHVHITTSTSTYTRTHALYIYTYRHVHTSSLLSTCTEAPDTATYSVTF